MVFQESASFTERFVDSRTVLGWDPSFGLFTVCVPVVVDVVDDRVGNRVFLSAIGKLTPYRTTEIGTCL